MLLLVNEDATDSGTGVFSRVFDLEAADLDNDAVTSPFEGRFPLNTGITRYVAATGQTVNLADAYKVSLPEEIAVLGHDCDCRCRTSASTNLWTAARRSGTPRCCACQ